MTKFPNSFLACSLLCLALASDASAHFTLSAHANAIPANAEITLARHDVDLRSTIRVLSTRANIDGSLSLDVKETAGIFVLKIGGGSETTLAIANGENIELSLVDGQLKPEGSPGTDILARYESFRKDSLARLVYPARAAKARATSMEDTIKRTQAEVDAYQEHLRELNDFVITNAGKTMALYGSSLRLNGDYRLEELAELVNSFVEYHGAIPASDSLKKRIQTARHVAAGNQAPELTAPNRSGQTENLSDYRGRYLLVDFWASWCPPCRLENQHYAKLTKQIDPDNFSIFAVNLDTSEKSWSRAVSQDQADWIHVSDLKGWTSELASTYGVNALPASFLIDPDGKIIAKDLRGQTLDAKLKELGLL